MNINFDILEQLRQYYDGELSAAAEKDLEQKIASDELYAFHHRAFRTLSKGVERGVSLREKEWMKDLQKKPLPEAEALNMEKMIANESALFRRRIFLWIGLVVLVVAGVMLLVWEPVDTTIKKNTPTHLQADELGKDEEEPSFGSTGISVTYDIEQRIFNAGTPPLLSARKNRIIHLLAQSAPELKYMFQSDTLKLFSDNVDKFEQGSFDWISLKSDGVIEDFLKIDNNFFAIPYTSDKRLLERAGKEKSETLILIPK